MTDKKTTKYFVKKLVLLILILPSYNSLISIDNRLVDVHTYMKLSEGGENILTGVFNYVKLSEGQEKALKHYRNVYETDTLIMQPPISSFMMVMIDSTSSLFSIGWR